MELPGRRAAWIFAGLVAAGALLRLADLENRPLHGDEAVGAVLSEQVKQTGSFVYVYSNRHGPFQYLAGGLAMVLGGESDFWIRLPHALLGSLLPLPLLFFRRRLTDPGWILATGALVFSPAFVYYSRYAIQEIDFALATLLFLGCGAAFLENGSRGALVGFFLAAGWMVTIKETFIIVWGCAFMALVLGAVVGGGRFRSALMGGLRSAARRWRVVLLGAAAGMLVFSAAYTDFFRNAEGLVNLARNLMEMVAQGASGADAVVLHTHPASFYLSLLLHYEFLIVALALAGTWFAFRTRRPFALFLALYSLLTLAVHLALRYKTPWLLLTPLLPMAVLAGYGGEELLALLGSRSAFRFPLAAALVLTLLPLPRALLLSFARPADPVAEPLIYHQTGEEQVVLARQIRRVLATLPADLRPKAIISLPYLWPLAWYLKDEQGVFYEHTVVPSGSPESLASVPILVTLESADPKFLKVFTGSAVVPPFSLPDHVSRRYVLVPPDYTVARLWIRRDLVSAASGH